MSNPPMDLKNQDIESITKQLDKNNRIDWSKPRPPTTTPFYERFGGYRKVADINPWTSLNRRSERHLNPVPRSTFTKYYFMMAFAFAFTTSWMTKKPLPATLDRNWKKAEREHMELSFQTQLRDHKLGQPIVIPEGYKTHSWPYSGIDGSYPEHYGVPEDEAEEFVNTAAQDIVNDYKASIKREAQLAWEAEARSS